MKKKTLGSKRRFALFTLLHIIAGVMAAGIGIIIMNAWVNVGGWNNSYSYMLAPWDFGEKYEDTILYNDILSNGIEDVTRTAVIRSQMETERQFDGKKAVDIVAYANRRNSNGDKEPFTGVSYYLEDLIKWGSYGFEWEEETVSARVTTSQDDNSAEITLEEQDYAAAEKTSAQDSEDMEITTQQVLVERYQPINGKSLRSYAADMDEYYELVRMLQNTCDDLVRNYDEYKNFGSTYESENTNLKYCYEMVVGDKKEYISNCDIKAFTADEYTNYFKNNYGQYLYYNTANMEFESNTDISRGTIRYYMEDYEYAYPEGTRIWIGVDTTYQAADAFKEGLTKYQNFMPYYWMIMVFVVGMAVVYTVLLIMLTVFEGRDRDYGLKTVDKIPGEVMAGFALVGGTFIALGYSMIYEYGYRLIELGEAQWLPGVAGILSFLTSIFAVLFYMTLVRRLKAHAFWKNTLIGLCFLWIKKKAAKAFGWGKTVMIKLYNNSDIVVRIAAPFIVFLGVNWILILTMNFLGVLICMVLDTAVCAFLLREAKCRQTIVGGIEKIRDGNLEYQLETKGMFGDNLILANSVNSIGEGIRSAVEKSMKDERLKADLITNVSHDIKTPLTSIINYVDLIKRENIQDEKISGYIEVLDAKSQRLKQLTEDLVEASKISSGNISYQMEKINFVELIYQTLGEFSEKFEEKQLSIVAKLPEHPVLIQADSRRIWRIIENIYNNIYKYALPGTRVYLDMRLLEEQVPAHVELSVKNISAQPLNINADELTERFIRGDVSRNTEGSGLGLSIAKNLTEAQKGKFTIYLDGDLFKIILDFPILPEDNIIE